LSFYFRKRAFPAKDMGDDRVFGPGFEITRMRALRLTTALVAYYMVSMYAALGGDFFMAMTGTSVWWQFLNGLPPNPLISIVFAEMHNIFKAVLSLTQSAISNAGVAK